MKRFGTHIDVFQIHRMDDTPAEEVMRALNDVIEKGWVRYIGASSVGLHQSSSQHHTDSCRLDAGTAVPEAPVRGRETRLPQIHIDAELSQSALP
jgi:aryl-alcohol dehydrogenase-like predicted oxidoreductase